MIELMTDLGPGTVGVRVRGVVDADDYVKVFVPAVEAARTEADHVNVLYVLEPGFAKDAAGAVWDDLTFGMSHLRGWGRIALVSDHDWARHAVGVGKVFMPGHLRYFPLGELAAARSRVLGEDPGRA